MLVYTNLMICGLNNNKARPNQNVYESTFILIDDYAVFSAASQQGQPNVNTSVSSALSDTASCKNIYGIKRMVGGGGGGSTMNLCMCVCFSFFFYIYKRRSGDTLPRQISLLRRMLQKYKVLNLFFLFQILLLVGGNKSMNTFQQYFSVTSPGHQANTVHRDHTHTHTHKDALRSQ